MVVLSGDQDNLFPSEKGEDSLPRLEAMSADGLNSQLSIETDDDRGGPGEREHVFGREDRIVVFGCCAEKEEGEGKSEERHGVWLCAFR